MVKSLIKKFCCRGTILKNVDQRPISSPIESNTENATATKEPKSNNSTNRFLSAKQKNKMYVKLTKRNKPIHTGERNCSDNYLSKTILSKYSDVCIRCSLVITGLHPLANAEFILPNETKQYHHAVFLFLLTKSTATVQ